MSTKMILAGTLAIISAVAAFDSVYRLGCRHGSREALDWEFSMVVDGKPVKIGKGSQLLRSKIEVKPSYSVNSVPTRLDSAKN
jgi:hypothetical protein